MKKVLLGETYSCNVYSVPNEVADNLREHCERYCMWLSKSPEAKSTRKKWRSPSDDGFIEYLNKFAFPQYESKLVKELEGKCSYIRLCDMPDNSFRDKYMANTNLPDQYRNNPEYNQLPYFYF